MIPRYAKAIGILAATLPVVLIGALSTGAVATSLAEVFSTLGVGGENFDLLVHIRLPRVLTGALVGACLGCAGAALQGLFRNPLAEPGFIGLVSGAGLGVGIWILAAGSSVFLPWGMPVAAFCGALALMALVWMLASASGGARTSVLLLSGIALNSLGFAGISVVNFLADDQQLRSLVFWFLGGLGGSTWKGLLGVLPGAVIGLTLLLSSGKNLNALALGEAEAFHLGVRPIAVRRRVFLGTALAVASAVTAGGGITFVGLVTPHLFRLCVGADSRWLLPGSALGGAALVVLADAVARSIVAPSELPVGIVTAFLGAPFFLWLITRHRQEALYA